MKIGERVIREVIEMQQHLHRFPELSRREEETCRFVTEKLRRLGVACVEVPDGGVLGFIHGAQEGKTVLLRADMDALPVAESDTNAGGRPKACVSQRPGVCHACGHDAHTAMLLGAAAVLQAERENLPGSVVLFFERGEEKIRQLY